MTRLVITAALMAEAVPLIDSYRLQKLPGEPGTHLFRGCDIDLLVCGMGAARTRQGLSSYFRSPGAGKMSQWLNLGIAGTRTSPIGELVWADHIGDQRIGLPEKVINERPIRVCSLQQASTDYRTDVLFDMEAEAWMACIAENIQQFKPERLFCAKVISDNPSSELAKIDKNWVTHLVRQNVVSLQKSINNIIKT